MKSSPRQLVDALHTAFGEHHSRAVHAKGIILSGIFIPDTQAATLTRAAHLQSTNSNVLVRFSDFTGIPNIPDNHDAANPRGFAVKFTLPDGASTDIVGHSFDGFPTPNSDQFRELLLAIAASGPGAEQPSGRRLHRYSPICESRSFMVGKVLLGCSFYISFDRRSRCRRGSGSG
ncbi:MAG TPA: catalase [Polyangiaceae bacterium]|nr:catalase [Polyangiaceae bacterium]